MCEEREVKRKMCGSENCQRMEVHRLKNRDCE